MIIDLIRHTKPDIDDGICYGQSDLNLASSFAQECRIVHAKAQAHYDCVISSPLQRCFKLAQTLTSPELIQDPRIQEYNFGDWELRPWSEFKSAESQTWMKNFVDQPAPNGDSILTMKERVLDFWSELLGREDERIAVVTHSGVQRLLHAEILETPLTHLFRLELDFGAVLRITHNKQAGLTTVKHL